MDKNIYINFLKLRFVQLLRIAKELTTFHKIVLLALFVILIRIIFTQFNQFPNAIYASGIISAILFSIHLSRKDKNFVALIAEKPMYVYITEYIFFLLPVFITIIFTKYSIYGIIVLLTIPIISLLNFNIKTKKGILNFTSILPSDCFEWISGFRKYGITVTIIYLAAISLIFIPYASLVLLLFLFIICSEFYGEYEPLQLLCIDEMPAKKFIHKKIKSHLTLYFKFIIPVIIVYTGFNLGSWPISLIFLILSSINIAFLILAKYSAYTPNQKSINNVINSIAIMGILIPFLMPVPMLLCIRNYSKAIKNLNQYLHAYN